MSLIKPMRTWLSETREGASVSGTSIESPIGKNMRMVREAASFAFLLFFVLPENKNPESITIEHVIDRCLAIELPPDRR